MSLPFSWKTAKEDAIAIKQRRARIMAKQPGSDFAIKHPDESRDANQGKYTLLNARIKKDTEKIQIDILKRRSKLVK